VGYGGFVLVEYSGSIPENGIKNMSDKIPRFLVIGSENIPVVKCCKWDAGAFPAIHDYDVTILNMRSLVGEGKGVVYGWKNFKQLEEDVQQSLISNRIIIVIVKHDTVIDLLRADGVKVRQSLLEGMFPFLQIKHETTETFVGKFDIFSKYIEKLEQQSPHTIKFWIDGVEMPRHSRILNIAETREGKSLALSVLYYDTTQRIIMQRYGMKAQIEEPSTIAGKAVFLPELPNISEEENVRLILEDMGVIPASEPAGFTKRGGSKKSLHYKEQASAIKGKIKVVDQDIIRVSAELERLQSHKRMLEELASIFKKGEMGG
jgi:hypothetical protein